MAISNRENAMISWLDQNPYKFYPHYDDQLSNAQVDMLIDGKFEVFDESWHESEWHYRQHADFDDIKSEFIKRFGLRHIEASWPISVQELFKEYRQICTKEVLEHCLTKTQTQIAVKPIKQSGNQIEFPNYDFPKEYNRYLSRYNKHYLGIENSWDAESMYYFDTLTLIGTVNLKDWYEKQAVPDFVKFGPDDFALTHNFINGSGGLGDVVIAKERKMRADIRNDKTCKYGVQSVFGFIGSVWKNELNCVWS